MSLSLTLGALRARGGLSPRGEGSGAFTRVGARCAGLSPDKTSEAFGADVVRRISVSPAATNTATEAAPALGGPGDAHRRTLADALSGTARWVAGTLGDAAATAVMGIVYKGIGDGPVTEDSLGNGLLDALRFVDRQFGTTSGDAFMAHLNGDGLNDALNNYFDNGRSERFMVAGSLAGSAVQGVRAAGSTLVQQATTGQGDAPDLAQSLLDALHGTGNGKAGPAGPTAARGTGTANAVTADTVTGDLRPGLLSGALASLSGRFGQIGRSGERTHNPATAYGPNGAALQNPAVPAPGLLLQASV